MSKESKKNYVEEMKKNFTDNDSVMIAQYQGLNVNELDALRKELREKGILFKITKNRITKIAIKETPKKDLEKYFVGPTAAAISSDPISTAKILTKFSKSNKIQRIIEKPENTNSNSIVSGIYFFTNDVIKVASSLKPSSRGELEIIDIVNYYLKREKLKK